VIEITREDLIYLLSMTYGYIDDELGGMDRISNHAVKLKTMINKYDIAMFEIFNEMDL